MILDEENKLILIANRIRQAKEAIDDVQLLIENSRYRLAMNRIYYGMFYMLLALGLQFSFGTSKHNQLIGWFNKKFISTRIIDVKYGKMLHQAFDNRISGDYDNFVEFNRKDVLKSFQEMRDFVMNIEKFIESK